MMLRDILSIVKQQHVTASQALVFKMKVQA